jgi:hypothetical protein
MRAPILIFMILNAVHSFSQPVAEDAIDTLTIVARCRFVGETGSILAAHFFRVTVDSVVAGHLQEKEIVFEANINTAGYRLFEFFPKKTQVFISVDSVFGLQDVPISKVYTCHGVATVKLIRRAEHQFWNNTIRIRYQHCREE